VLKSGDWEAVFFAAKRRFERNRTPAPLISMCEASLRNGDIVLAEDCLRQLTLLKKDLADIPRLRAACAEASGQIIEAIEWWRQYSELTPHLSWPSFRGAWLCLRDKRYLRLIRIVETLRQKGRHNPKLESIEQQLDLAIRSEPAAEVKRRARDLTKEGRWEEARQAWELSFLQNPNDASAILRTCECLNHVGAFGECAETMSLYLAKIKDAPSFQRAGRRALIGLSQIDGALATLDADLLNSMEPDGVMALIELLADQRQVTINLIAVCDHLDAGKNLVWLKRLLRDKIDCGYLDIAHFLSPIAALASPRDFEITLCNLELAQKSGNIALCETLVSKIRGEVVLTDIGLPLFIRYIEVLFIVDGETDELKHVIRACLKNVIGTSSKLFDMAASFYTKSLVTLVSLVFRQAEYTALIPREETSFIGALFTGPEGDNPPVDEEFHPRVSHLLAHVIDEDADRVSKLAEILLERGRLAILDVLLSMRLDFLQDDLRLMRVRAQLARRHGRFDDSVALWTHIIHNNPNDVWAHINRTNALIHSGDVARANAAYDALMELKGADGPSIQFELSFLAAQLGYMERAKSIALNFLNGGSGVVLRLRQQRRLARVLTIAGAPGEAWNLYGYKRKSSIEIAGVRSLGLILDPGLNISSGHHVNYNLFAWNFLKSLDLPPGGLSPLLLSGELSEGSAELDEVRRISCLRFEPYAFDEYPNFHLHLQSLNDAFYFDLSQLNILNDTPVVFFHSMRANMIEGFSRWIDDIFCNKHGFIIIGLIEVDHLDKDPETTAEFFKIYAKALRRLASNQNIGLLVYSETAQGEGFLRGLGIEGLEIRVFPYLAASLHLDRRSRDEAKEDDSRIVFGVIGGTRELKGSGLIPKLVVETRDLSAECRWNMQLDVAKLPPLMGARDLHYINLMRRQSNVLIESGALSSADYFKLLESIDVLILPYDTRYAASGSGVFYEAIYRDKFLIVPRQTFMPAVLDSLDHPHMVLETLSDVCLESAVRSVVADAAVIKQKLARLRSVTRRALPAHEFYEMVRAGIAKYC
jgi:tetratricopeptide (TPR) repeat protein